MRDNEALKFLRKSENIDESTSIDLLAYESIDASYSGVVKKIDTDFSYGIQEIVAKIDEMEDLDEIIHELKAIMDYYQGIQGERALFVENAMQHLKIGYKIKLIANQTSRIENARVYELEAVKGTVTYNRQDIYQYFQAVQLTESENFKTIKNKNNE